MPLIGQIIAKIKTLSYGKPNMASPTLLVKNHTGSASGSRISNSLRPIMKDIEKVLSLMILK